MSFYLLELGCEELPASFISLAADYLKNKVEAELNANLLNYSTIKSGGTPRRIYLYIDGLPDKQGDREETIQGPPTKIAFKIDGSVSDIGLKFLESKGISILDSFRHDTPKGDYLAGIKKIKGQDSKDLIRTIISDAILSIPFPKSMKWGDKSLRFARPLKYILSIWDSEVLSLNIEGVSISNETFGHHFLSPKSKAVKNIADYINILKESFVILDEKDRTANILEQFNKLSSEGDYVIDVDEQLLSTVSNLVEYPHCIQGEFEKDFLELPEQVLITSMKNHQKYFPVYKHGELQAKFVGVSNINPEDDTLIRQGYQRVIKARLNDAMFFYKNDKSFPLEKRVEMLKKVIYQEKLGTSYEKMERFRELAIFIGSKISSVDINEIREAATLCKADLMCEMVYEFPELQGYMGKVYAKLQGRSEEVAVAIEEHYMPRFAGDKLPSSDIGKIIAISDKLDTIMGAFSIGMIPTGNIDPYGLRRNAIGIINIIENSKWFINLYHLLSKSFELLGDKSLFDKNDVIEKVLNFIMQRHRQVMIGKGVDADAFDAASYNYHDIIIQEMRAVALSEAKVSEDFKSIASGFKRINNIIKKINRVSFSVDPSIFQDKAEKALYDIYLSKNDTIDSLISVNDWKSAVFELSNFAEPLSDFFNSVMVMSDDITIRNNRISLLASIHSLFTKVGDLSQIQ